MTELKFDLLAVGNALVDVLASVPEDFIARQGLEKGAMTLIGEDRAATLYATMAGAVEVSGGSAANTVAGFASFGGRGAYIGKVATDALGDSFRRDMTAQNISYLTKPLSDGATGRCLVHVTPDGQRTMNTFLGAAVTLGPDDIDPAIVQSSRLTYLEGYLFDPPQAKAAFRLTSKLARQAGRQVALTLSDPFCVERHRADFCDLVANHVDILFANEHEIMALYKAATFDDAVRAVAADCQLAVLTRSAQGAVIVFGKQIVLVAAEKTTVVDTTGAGDQYAAGFLYGYAAGMPVESCGRLGALAAAEIISHMGPRPAIKYAELLHKLAA